MLACVGRNLARAAVAPIDEGDVLVLRLGRLVTTLLQARLVLAVPRLRFLETDDLYSEELGGVFEGVDDLQCRGGRLTHVDLAHLRVLPLL